MLSFFLPHKSFNIFQHLSWGCGLEFCGAMTLSVCLPDIEANRLNCIPSRGRSDSRVVIHEKWGRSTPELHQPGRGNLERGNSEESHIKVRARRLRYILSGLQVLFSYKCFSLFRADWSCLVVILLSQSLLLFQATKDNLMTSTSSIWPNNVKLSWDIIAIVLNLIISLIAICTFSATSANAI